MIADFHIIVSVNPQYLFYDVSFQLYVYPVGGDIYQHC